MTPKSEFMPPALHDYIIEHGTPPDAVQQALIAETAALPNAGMQISPDQGAFLTMLAKLVGAQYAVEVGTFTGYSALSIARGLTGDGRLLCCDVNAEWTAVAQRYWERAGVDDRIELRLAPGLDTLRGLPVEPHIDFSFIDADKPGYIGYWEELVPRTRQGGLLVVDNVLFHGSVIDGDADGENEVAIKAFNEYVLDDDRVELVMLPVADGLTLARKR